jgi:hypothetical protein
MMSLLWVVFVVLIVLWLLGFTVVHLGSIVWALLVVAAIVLLFNLFNGSRSGRWY